MCSELLCNCNCGQPVKPGNKYILGHNRCSKYTIETKPQTLCLCGCGEITNPGNIYVHGHQSKGEIGWNKGLTLEEQGHKFNCQCCMCKTGRGENRTSLDGAKKWRKENPKKVKEKSSKGGKATHKKYLGHARRMVLTAMKNNPNLQSEAGKISQEKMKKNDPKRYKEIHIKAGKNSGISRRKNPEKLHNDSVKAGIIANQKWKERDPEGYYVHKKRASKMAFIKHPNLASENALKALESRRNKTYIWQGVHFMSEGEMAAAKKILKKPIKGVNCSIRIGRKCIDFFPQEEDLMFQGKFVEYHPMVTLWDGNKTKEEYYDIRKEIIDKSNYKGTKLILINNLEEINEL